MKSVRAQISKVKLAPFSLILRNASVFLLFSLSFLSLLAKEERKEPSCLQCARVPLPVQREIPPSHPSHQFSRALVLLPHFSLTAHWDLDSGFVEDSLSLHNQGLFPKFLGYFFYLLWTSSNFVKLAISQGGLTKEEEMKELDKLGFS